MYAALIFEEFSSGDEIITESEKPAPPSSEAVWEGANRALNRKLFNPQNKLSVKLTGDMASSEGAVDLGGPAREFFTLVTERLINCQLFFGGASSKFLSFNERCLEEREYYLAGQVFAN